MFTSAALWPQTGLESIYRRKSGVSGKRPKRRTRGVHDSQPASLKTGEKERQERERAERGTARRPAAARASGNQSQSRTEEAKD